MRRRPEPAGRTRILMDKLIIEGGTPLKGTIDISGSKNAALPILFAGILLDAPMVYTNVPDLRDIHTTIKLLNVLGCSCSYDDHRVELKPGSLLPEAPYDLVRTMRASVLCLGPLLARIGQARVALPGGCAIGARPVDQHLKGLELMGATFELEEGYIMGHCDKLRGAHITFDMPTVGGTENLLMAAVLTAIVFVERAQRRIPISYAKRQIGRKMFGGQNTHLPLRVNTAGVIPPIFASSLLLFPATVGQFSTNEYVRMVTDFFAPHGVLYNVLYVVLIFFFCYFYTAIIIDPKDMAENLKKNGGFVPGIRPGERTQEYIDTVLSRLTLSGAVYISAAHAHDRQVQRAVLLRWYQPADPCRRGHGLHESGRVPHDLNPVPGVDEQGGPQGRPHVILAKRAGKS